VASLLLLGQRTQQVLIPMTNSAEQQQVAAQASKTLQVMQQQQHPLRSLSLGRAQPHNSSSQHLSSMV
jgi:hypothetical protein